MILNNFKLLDDTCINKTDSNCIWTFNIIIRGEPMVNDRTDADRFENIYGVKVIS